MNRVQARRLSAPPRLNLTEVSLPLTALWEKLPSEEQRHVLGVFENILLRKLHALPTSKEVAHEEA